jgi:hypothetical protein
MQCSLHANTNSVVFFPNELTGGLNDDQLV